MRIIHLINSLGGSGGAENGLVREITRFDGSVDQIVLRLFAKDDLEDRLRGHGIEVHGLGFNSSRASINWSAATLKVRRWIRRFDPDVLHTSLFTSNLVGQLSTRGTSLPVVSTFTQSGDIGLVRSFQPGASSRSASVQRGIATWTARATNVWFRSLTRDAMKTNVESLGIPKDRVVVIPRGVDIDRTPTEEGLPPSLEIPSDAPLAVNVGRQAAQKGHLHLIDAFEVLADRLPNVHLAVLGRTGDATEAIATRVSASPFRDQIHFLGYRPDAHRIVRNADVFVFSSMMEGLGTAVLEAMAAGVPIVSFDIPPVREITDGVHARLVPVGDGRGLGIAAYEVITGRSPDTSEGALKHVAETYEINHVARRLQEYLTQVADAGG